MQDFQCGTFDKACIGNNAGLKHTLPKPDVELIAVMFLDVNPTHLDAPVANSDIFRKVVAHGIWGTGWKMMRRSAVPIVSGMISATILTLIVIPTIWALAKEFSIKYGQPNQPA